MHSVIQDTRYGIAAFARTPGFTQAAVLSLAIGVGVNTSIYSVASALLLHPLPYADAERLTILWNRSPGLGITEDWFSTAQYFDMSKYWAVENQSSVMPRPGERFHRMVSLSASAYGNGCSNSA